MSDRIAAAVWRVFRRAGGRWPAIMTFAGPVALVAIIGAWAGLVVFGCSLVYLPHLRSAFVLAPGMDASTHRNYIDAFNISLGALITVGADFNATNSWIRLLMGCEAVIGFGLLTASVSWLLSIYPVLETRRTVAHQATLLHRAQLETGVDPVALPAGEAQAVLNVLTVELTSLRNEMAQFPITYYFHMGEAITALSGIMGYIAQLAGRASSPQRPPAVQLAGTALGGAVDSYLEFIANSFLHISPEDKKAILRAYAHEQMRELVDDVPRSRDAA